MSKAFTIRKHTAIITQWILFILHFGFLLFEFVFLSFDKNRYNLIAFVLFNRQVLGMVAEKSCRKKK